MHNTIAFISSGLTLGLTAGITPGPLMALVISETLKHGPKEGSKVASAPLITDGSIIILTALLLTKLASFKPALGILSLLGSGYIVYLAYENFTMQEVNFAESSSAPKSIKKGITTNLLNPHPYIFWITVGTPTIIRGFNINLVTGSGFIISFFTAMIGIKLIIAQLVGRSKKFLQQNWYLYTMKVLGGILLIFAALLCKEGIKLLGIL